MYGVAGISDIHADVHVCMGAYMYAVCICIYVRMDVRTDPNIPQWHCDWTLWGAEGFWPKPYQEQRTALQFCADPGVRPRELWKTPIHVWRWGVYGWYWAL